VARAGSDREGWGTWLRDGVLEPSGG